jgi:hypothetical protein
MFKDELRDTVWNEIRQRDVLAFASQLTAEVFAEAAERAQVRIGQSALNLVNLVWLGVASAMQHGQSFLFVLTATLKMLEDQPGFQSSSLGRQKKRAIQKQMKKKGQRKSKHHPHRDDPTQVSEEAFVQARQRMPLGFWLALLFILAERFQREHPQHGQFRGFRLLAMDGTLLTLPNAKALCQHYGRPKNGERKKAVPQARLVMLTLPGTRIPIAYQLSRLADSELTLANRLLPQVRANDLLLMDRGFISYGLFWGLQHRGAYFGTRLKKGLKFRKQKQLGPKDWLVQWTPQDSRRQWKHLPRSIQLRVIHYQFPGFRASAVVTNVLDPKRLSREDWVRIAHDCDDNGKFTPGLYHRRWEIETSYFELKIVLKLKQLRSRTPASLEYEVAGRIIYYLLLRWLIASAAKQHGLDPLRISFINAVRELELMRASLITNSPEWVTRVLLPRLLERIAAHTVPLRPDRHYPRHKDTQPKDRGHGSKQLPAKLTKRVNTNHRNNQQQPLSKA